MKLVMLSGNSLANRDWVYDAQKHLSSLFSGFYIQDYEHWASGEDWINLDNELEVLRKVSRNFGDDYAVFAKSIGTVLAVQALWHGILRPKFMLLLGLPMDYINDNYPQFREVLADNPTPLSVIHNEFDKVGSAEEARAYLASKLDGRGDYNFIETPGDTHDYLDYSLMTSEIARLKALTA